jgi:hypothetical protein
LLDPLPDRERIFLFWLPSNLLTNLFQHPFQIAVNFPIVKPEHLAPPLLQLLGSPEVVVFTTQVTAAVQFDHQQVFCTEKVSIKGWQGMLSPEFGSQLSVAQVLPEGFLGRCALMSEGSGLWV